MDASDVEKKVEGKQLRNPIVTANQRNVESVGNFVL